MSSNKVTVRMPAKLRRMLELLGKKQNRTLSNVIVTILKEAVNYKEEK